MAFISTYLVAFMRDRGVVLNLPESLSKSFPLVCFSKLLLAFIIWGQILGPQEGPTTVSYYFFKIKYVHTPFLKKVLTNDPSFFPFCIHVKKLKSDNINGKILTSHVFQKRTLGTCLKATLQLLRVTRQSVN